MSLRDDFERVFTVFAMQQFSLDLQLLAASWITCM